MDRFTKHGIGYNGHFVPASVVGSVQPYGYAGAWSANTTPMGIHPPIAPSQSALSLPPRYSLSANPSLDATAHLQREYAYSNLYNRYYNGEDRARMGILSSTAIDHPRVDFSQIPPATFGPSFAPSETFLGHRAINFPGNEVPGTHGIKLETVPHQSRSLGAPQSIFRVPQLPAQNLHPPMAVKTEAGSARANNVDSGSDLSYLDNPPASVQIDVVGMGNDDEHSREEYGGPSSGQSRERVSNGHGIKDIPANADSGMISDFSNNVSDAHQGVLSRSNNITPPAGSDGQNGKFHTPEGNAGDSGCFITPIQHPYGKQLFPDPVCASTPMEDDSLWRPWNKSGKNLKRSRFSDQASDSPNMDPSQAELYTHNGDSYPRKRMRKYSKPDTNGLSQGPQPTFISPVPPATYARQRAQSIRRPGSPQNQAQTSTHSFSIAAMLNEDRSAKPFVTNQHQESQEEPRSTQIMPYNSNIAARSVYQANVQQYIPLQSYMRPATSMIVSTTRDAPVNLSYNSSHPPSLQERLAYNAVRNEQFYHNAQLMLHTHAQPRPEHTMAPFIPAHPILPPAAAIAATFGSEPASNIAQLQHFSGYQHSHPFPGPIASNMPYPAIAQASSATESEVLDLSDTSRSAEHHPVPPTESDQGHSYDSDDGFSHDHSSDELPPASSPSPIPSTSRPRVQPASFQPIKGVVLSVPPPGARPAFIVCAHKAIPKVPDSREAQDELRDALGRLFVMSNLPKVPPALVYNVHALAYYPYMQHLFHLYTNLGVNIYEFKFGAYGQAFENPRLRELGEAEFNNQLDSMCYVGDDNLLHCLVMRHIDNGARCDHVASELGKMRRHAKNHYPEKKWVCCFCRAQMPDLTDMERHTSTHTSLKPFRCVDCNKFFSQKVTLSNHMHMHHQKKLQKMDPRKSFTCRQDGCLFQDHQREACIEHLINHHRDDEYIRRSKRGMWPFPPKPKAGSRTLAITYAPANAIESAPGPS
ncbi:hypothetical protein EGW08_006078 [Elysia chlorotica]|uniref:C2H2-type domain-containing protein n=1 Tax=Elysia chlorotica TaxID=188477 RepID=A0A433TX56_ELYCH|nr:hypothetical protein EGW08_006078 [Elysia chlorotica]